MHRALLLPEIVAAIIRTKSSFPGFLHMCLFISKTFSFEACRILWYACGACCYDEHATPNIKNLARIVIQDATRAQYYANFIHVLSFQEVEQEDNKYLDEATWHNELVSLQFPQLQDLSLHRSVYATELNTGDVIIHYAQPNIETFTVYEGSCISDSLFEKFTHSCPRLKSLELSSISASNVSKDGLSRFCNKADALTCLIIRTGAHDSWSYEAFEAIARLPNLTYITIPDVQDNWVYSICNTDSSTPIFPSVEHLDTGMSDLELKCLTRHVLNLNHLVIGLQNLPPSTNILASASNFPNLTHLEISFGAQNRVSGNDLLLLAQKCPLLESISLGGIDDSALYSSGPGCRPASVGINDDLIDEVARTLGARIILLRIIFDTSDMLTWQSILSLAQHCRNLLDLTISCDFDWQEAMSGTLKYIFPALDALHLVFDDNIREMQHANDYNEETIEDSAHRMFDFAPKLSRFWIQGGNDADNRFEASVMSIFYEAWNQTAIVEE
ncbi:hypothetical protein EAF04_005030 [Stromatinia cepivora]|nr:hypothetical protein EAF04_005030 [Stromatinia cepivora]